MKALPTDDPLFGRCNIRVDGRMLHDVYLLEVKAPEEASVAWDYCRVMQTIPAEKAWRPLSEGNCPLVPA